MLSSPAHTPGRCPAGQPEAESQYPPAQNTAFGLQPHLLFPIPSVDTLALGSPGKKGLLVSYLIGAFFLLQLQVTVGMMVLVTVSAKPVTGMARPAEGPLSLPTPGTDQAKGASL